MNIAVILQCANNKNNEYETLVKFFFHGDMDGILWKSCG